MAPTLSRGDRIVVLRGASWADYKRVMEMRGDRAALDMLVHVRSCSAP